MTDLATLFARKQARIIEWNGMTLFSLIELHRVRQRLRINFLASRLSPVQGLQIRVRGGTLSVNGSEAKDVILWRDTAPDSIDVEVGSRDGGVTSVRLWNVWRGGLGVTQAWLGNAAIQLDGNPETGRYVLRCSDGEGEPDFDDLVAEVIVT